MSQDHEQPEQETTSVLDHARNIVNASIKGAKQTYQTLEKNIGKDRTAGAAIGANKFGILGAMAGGPIGLAKGAFLGAIVGGVSARPLNNWLNKGRKKEGHQPPTNG